MQKIKSMTLLNTSFVPFAAHGIFWTQPCASVCLSWSICSYLLLAGILGQINLCNMKGFPVITKVITFASVLSMCHWKLLLPLLSLWLPPLSPQPFSGNVALSVTVADTVAFRGQLPIGAENRLSCSVLPLSLVCPHVALCSSCVTFLFVILNFFPPAHWGIVGMAAIQIQCYASSFSQIRE